MALLEGLQNYTRLVRKSFNPGERVGRFIEPWPLRPERFADRSTRGASTFKANLPFLIIRMRIADPVLRRALQKSCMLPQAAILRPLCPQLSDTPLP